MMKEAIIWQKQKQKKKSFKMCETENMLYLRTIQEFVSRNHIL